MRSFCALGIAMAVAGCASAPLASPEEDVAAKAFLPPPDRAAVYLFRDEAFAGIVPISVSIDDVVVGTTTGNTYYYWSVAPGAHRIMSHSENASVLDLIVKPGRNYFVWQEIKMGIWSPRSELQVVDEGRGRLGVLSSRRASDLPVAVK